MKMEPVYVQGGTLTLSSGMSFTIITMSGGSIAYIDAHGNEVRVIPDGLFPWSKPADSRVGASIHREDATQNTHAIL